MFILKNTRLGQVMEKAIPNIARAELHIKNYPISDQKDMIIIEVPKGTNQGQRRGIYLQHKQKYPDNYCSMSGFYRRVQRRGIDKAINTPKLKHGRPNKELLAIIYDKTYS